MAYSNKDTPSPEFKPIEFDNAIQLSDFDRNRTAHLSYYYDMMADPEKQQHNNATLEAEPTAKTSAKPEHREYIKSDPDYPNTSADILFEHVLYQRRKRSEKYHESEGDIVVDWCIAITKTITGLFLIFMIVYTAVKWWSLGPHYAKNYQDQGARLQDPGHGT